MSHTHISYIVVMGVYNCYFDYLSMRNNQYFFLPLFNYPFACESIVKCMQYYTLAIVFNIYVWTLIYVHLYLWTSTTYYYHLFLFLHIHFFTYIPCMHSQKAVGSRRGKTTFKGICIARKNKGIASTIVLRNVLHGMVLERNVPLYSPHLLDLRVVAKRKSRRAKLYYLRKKEIRYSKV